MRDITSVWIDDHGFNGRVEFDMVLADSNATNWCEAVLALSGLAAEAMIYRKFYAGHAEGDLLRALDRARKIEASGNVQPPWTPTTARYVDFRGVFDVKITDGELCILLAAYGKARLILDQRHEMHGRLVGALLTCRRLDRKAIRTCLGDRWAIRAFGFAMRECFV